MDWDLVLRWIEFHPGAAGWLQAIGSLVAIGIAIAVPAFQYRHTQQRESFKQKEYLRALLQVSQVSVAVIEAAAKDLERGFKYGSISAWEAQINEAASAVNDFSPQGVVDPQVRLHLAELRQQLARVSAHISAISMALLTSNSIYSIDEVAGDMPGTVSNMVSALGSMEQRIIVLID